MPKETASAYPLSRKGDHPSQMPKVVPRGMQRRQAKGRALPCQPLPTSGLFPLYILIFNRGQIYGSSTERTSRAGLPATIIRGATSFVTIEPAATTAPSPIVTPGMMIAPAPIQA